MKRFASLSVSLALIGNLLFSLAPSAIAAGCPDPKKDGKTIGKVVVGKTNTDVKYVDYEAGEALDPPNSPLNVGLSIRHMPLSSPIGSSLLVWHINYKGCEGKLNILNDKKIGFKFSIVDEKGFKQEFKISKKFQVKKGKYKSEWFQLNGPRQLTLVTCIGKVVNHHYEDNLVIIAVPLNGVDYTPSTTPSASASASATPTASVSLSTSPTSSHSPSSTN
jgi:hypothetical protein